MKTAFKIQFHLLLWVSAFTAGAQVPVLNSFPSANAVIYLDFDGQYVDGTFWNYVGPIDAAASGLTTSQITEVFDRVSEDYRPFEINITTDESVYNAAPLAQRMRIVITSTYQWYGSGAGGVSYMNSFAWGNNTPAFVFSSLLGYNAKNVAEATSHEAGHTLGLRHQSSYDGSCTKTSDYNWGQGTGEISWAPIMGAGYYKNLTLWHNGANSLGCSSYQSDLDIITSAANGFGFRADDHSNAFATATVASFDIAKQFNIDGIIEQTADKDLFKFTLTSFSSFILDAIPYNVGSGNAGSDLDLNIDLLDQTQTIIGSYNPGTELSSIIDTVLEAGDYYIRVDGQGNMYTSDYGSLGSYSLQGTFNDNPILPVRQLELSGRSEKGNHLLNWVFSSEETIIAQQLEVSYDGSYFTPVAHPAAQERNYAYTYTRTSAAHYRAVVTLGSGKKIYSNIITLLAGKKNFPELVTNRITGNYLQVNSPSEKFSYFISDYSGKLISRGSLRQGYSEITTGNLPRGLYIIRFSDQQTFSSQKFVVQ